MEKMNLTYKPSYEVHKNKVGEYSAKSFVDIALQFKFSDQLHLNKFIKMYFGVTPLQSLKWNKE